MILVLIALLGCAPEAADTETDTEVEVDLFAVDSDGDGYTDGDEIAEGSDPADESDGIYAGGWPYQRDKDRFEGPALEDAVADRGEPFARLQVLDQHGEMLDLYDLAGHGKPIVIGMNAVWCPPCGGLAAWIAGDATNGWNEAYPHIRDRVESGEMYWVTVLGQNNYGATPSLEDLQEWDAHYPNARVPTLSADEAVANTYVLGAWPSMYFLDENLEIVALPVGTSSDFYAALAEADAWQP